MFLNIDKNNINKYKYIFLCFVFYYSSKNYISNLYIDYELKKWFIKL